MDLHGFLQRNRQGLADTEGLGQTLSAMVAAGLDQLPLPGGGQTLLRFSLLFILVAGLSLVPRSFSLSTEIASAAIQGATTVAILWAMLLPSEKAAIRALAPMRRVHHG